VGQRLRRLLSDSRASWFVAVIFLVAGIALAGLWHNDRDAATQRLAAAQAALKSAQHSLDDIQQTMNSLQNELSTLKSDPPHFVLVSSNFTGGCADYISCPVSATFINQGGTGSAIAIFRLKDQAGTTEYASCSAVIPSVGRNESASANCTAAGTGLYNFFQQNPKGSVYLFTDVQNPPSP